jgi:hypothetical protein
MWIGRKDGSVRVRIAGRENNGWRGLGAGVTRVRAGTGVGLPKRRPMDLPCCSIFLKSPGCLFILRTCEGHEFCSVKSRHCRISRSAEDRSDARFSTLSRVVSAQH